MCSGLNEVSTVSVIMVYSVFKEPWAVSLVKVRLTQNSRSFNYCLGTFHVEQIELVWVHGTLTHLIAALVPTLAKMNDLGIPNIPAWYRSPQGSDFPTDLQSKVKGWRRFHLSIGCK